MSTYRSDDQPPKMSAGSSDRLGAMKQARLCACSTEMFLTWNGLWASGLKISSRTKSMKAGHCLHNNWTWIGCSVWKVVAINVVGVRAVDFPIGPFFLPQRIKLVTDSSIYTAAPYTEALVRFMLQEPRLYSFSWTGTYAQGAALIKNSS